MALDANAIITLLVGIAAVAGGYWGGRKNTNLAMQTVNLLESRVAILQAQVNQIPALHDRINILEDLVTQRANVEKVIEIVTRIEGKIDAPTGQP